MILKFFKSDFFKDHRIPVSGVLAAVVLSVGWLYRSAPMGEMNNEYSDLQAEVGLLKRNLHNGSKIKDNLEIAKEYTSLMSERVVTQNLAEIHDIFYTLESETGVVLTDFQHPQALLEPIKLKLSKLEYQPLTMAVTVDGTFKNVLKFIRSLEQYPVIYRYSGLNITTKTAATETDKISLNLSFDLLSSNET